MTTCKNSLTTNCQCMHNPSHDCKTDHSGLHAYETIDMSCSKNENNAKLMTDGIKIAQLRSHKSKFCPVRNRPKLWNFQNDNERATKTSKTSRNRIHSSLSLTTLCTAFCILHCNCRSSLPELSVTTQLASESKIYTQQSMLQAP